MNRGGQFVTAEEPIMILLRPLVPAGRQALPSTVCYAAACLCLGEGGKVTCRKAKNDRAAGA